MNQQITTPFTVTLWDVKPYDEPANSPALARGVVKKTFDGDLKGVSTGEILMCSAEDGSAAYTVMERFEGELRGRTGTFVLLHGATHTPNETSRALGQIVPNSGTSELAGIRGTVEFKADENGKNIILDFTL